MQVGKLLHLDCVQCDLWNNLCDVAAPTVVTTPTQAADSVAEVSGSASDLPANDSSALLVFAYGSKGLEHAHALHDALTSHFPKMSLWDGFTIFQEVQTMQGSAAEFFGGVVPACDSAWHNTHDITLQGSFIDELQRSLATAPALYNSHNLAVKEFWQTIRSYWHGTLACAPDHGLATAKFILERLSAGVLRLQGVQPNKIQRSMYTDADQGFDGLITKCMAADAAVQALVIETLDSCSWSEYLPTWDKMDRKTLATMQATQDDVQTMQPVLAAFVIQGQQDMAGFDALVRRSRIEVVLTLVLRCTKFTSCGSPLYVNGSLARCEDISILMYASAAKSVRGE